MTERWNNQRTGDASIHSGAEEDRTLQFGWATVSSSEAQSAASHNGGSARAVSDQSNGSGSASATQVYSPADTPHRFEQASLSADDMPTGEIPEFRSITSDAEPAQSRTRTWPGASRSGRNPIYSRIPHLAIIVVAVAILLGGGFWQQGQSSVMPGGTDSIHSLMYPTGSDGASVGQQAMSSTRDLVASTSDNVMEGYLSTASLSVTPQQLGIETYVAGEGQTIDQVAEETGRSTDTLLWANDYRDPSRSLSSGTQLRIPPVNGMLHMVNDGDTLENIAQRYEVAPDAITSYEPNGIEHSADLVPNRMIMVPGGSMPMRDEVILYTVQEGDELWHIAERFGLEPQTILWANSLPNLDMIAPGQQLAILPTDGVMIEVDENDAVGALAEEYGVDPAAIRDWPANGLGPDGTLVAGQSVMVPGGSPPGPPEPAPQPDPPAPDPAPDPQPAAQEPAQQASEPEPAPQPEPEPEPQPQPAQPQGTGRFAWPTTGVITQYFHASHNGWDIASNSYTEIWAADSGTVTFSGWNNYGLGYAVAIDHGNGYVTWYGHMAEQPAVRVGQTVSQGEYIGPMGSTGFSTGPHIHFVIVYNGVYQDPGSYLQ